MKLLWILYLLHRVSDSYLVPYYRHVQSLGEPTEGKKEKGKKKEKEKKSKQSGLKSADETKSHGANDVASGSSEIVGREDLEEKPPTPLQKLEDTEEPLSYINERYGAELVGKEDLEAEEKPPLEDTEEPSEDPLTRELAEKEAELHQLLESEVDLVESKGKEMSSLLSAVDELEDKKHDVDKKVAEIDSQMAELQTRKDQLVTYKEDKERKLEKLLMKKTKLENFIEEKEREQKETRSRLEKEIEEIEARLQETERARKNQAQPYVVAHQTPSSSPLGMSPAPQPKPEGLRLIVIDGCNVARAHGLHRTFSVRGLVLAYEHFREKGHQV